MLTTSVMGGGISEGTMYFVFRTIQFLRFFVEVFVTAMTHIYSCFDVVCDGSSLLKISTCISTKGFYIDKLYIQEKLFTY